MAELFGLLFFALAVLLFFGLITSLIILIVTGIRKKPVKNTGIMTGVLGGSFVFVIVLMFVALANADDTTVPQTASYPTSSSNAQSDDEEAPEAEEETDDTEYEITEEEQAEFDDEYDKKMAEAKEEREAEEGNRTEDLDNYRDDVDVRDIERNPDDYTSELVVLEGKVIQVLEEDGMSAYRMAVNDDYDRIVLVSVLSSSLEERLLENDYITVHGEFTDLLTYETVVGGSRTVPSFVASGERIELQETVE